MKLNINSTVRVRLTDAGRQELRRQVADLRRQLGGLPFQAHPREDSEGWSRWQLWALMSQLGHMCQLGFGDLPFETEIEIEDSPDA